MRQRLIHIIPLDKIPEKLSFISEGITKVLNRVYFENYIFNKTKYGEAGIGNILLVMDEKLGIDFGNSGFSLAFNPHNTVETSLDVSFSYNWEILKYIKLLNVNIESINALEYFKIISEMLGITDEDIVKFLIDSFITGPDPLNQFVNDANANGLFNFNNPLTITNTTNNIYKDIVYQIYDNDIDFIDLIFELYLNTSNDPLVLVDNSFSFLSNWVQGIDLNWFLKLLIPYFSFSLNDLEVALQFDRKVLKPLDVSGNVIEDEDIKSELSFNIGSLHFNTKFGFDFKNESSLSLSPSQIGNTPLTILLQNARIDLSDRTNIAAADAEGRPNSFKGIHIEYAEINFPSMWEDDADGTGFNPSIVTRDLLVGSEGGLSGTIGLTGDNANSSSPTVHTIWTNFVIDGGTSAFIYFPSSKKVLVSGKKHTDTLSDDDRVKIFKLNTTTGTRVRDADNNWYLVDATGVVTEITAPNLASLLKFKIGNVEITLEEFSLTFHQNEVIASKIIGTIDFPALNGKRLNVIVDISNGFLITVYSGPLPEFGSAPLGTFPETTSGIDIVNSEVINITLDGFQIGRIDEIFRIGFAGSIKTKFDIPIINKFIPNELKINKFLYREDTGVEFDLDINWKEGTNLAISNDGVDTDGIGIRFPINLDKLFKLEALQLNAVPITDGISAEVLLMGAGMNFGDAVVFKVDGLGFGLDFVYVGNDGDGNVGPFDMDMRIIPPTGIGVKVDAGVVVGGGYLFFGEDEYFGAVELVIADKISIVVVGLLNTRLEDGSKGISLVVIIGVTGLNLALGAGFVLDGIGGMLGIQRTINTDVLREGLRNGTLDSILFPEDVVDNIHKIISDIKAVYPIKKKQFVFGPAIRLGWGGGKSIVELDVGLVVEFPDPVKIALLGKLAIRIGEGDNNIVLIQVAFMAVLNFEKKRFMFDAAIYDSNILVFTLEGDIALRIFWGENSAFLLSVGGFHPDYTPEENMQVNNMRRLSISLLNDNPRLSINTYMAVTSNTFQFGAGAEFYFSLAKIVTLEGGFGFDCLFQFNPFYFTISMYAYLGVYVAGAEVMSISLEGSLSGPGPWNIKGKASFKFLMVKYAANIDHTWGDKKETSLPNINVLPLVKAQMELSKNWTGELPSNKNGLVTFAKIEVAADDILIHPLGTLTIQQNVVPIGIKLDKYGKNKIDGVNLFEINSIDIGGISIINTEALPKPKETFAPDQFFNMNDDEKLRKKSFEYYPNGIKAKGNDDLVANFILVKEVEYEVAIIDEEVGMGYEAGTFAEHADFNFDKFIKGGAIGKSELSKKNSKLTESIQSKVTLGVEKFGIVNNNDLAHHDSANEPLYTRAEALSHLNGLISNNPNLEGELSVMPEFELI